MNKTTITIGYFILIGLMVISGSFIMVFSPEAITPFSNLVVIVLGLGVTGAVTFSGLEKLDKRVGIVSKNVNGNTTKLLEENAALRQALTDSVMYRKFVMPDIMTEETLKRIDKDRSELDV